MRWKTNNHTRQIFNKIQLFCRTNVSASNTVFEAVRQILRITVCEKVCGQTGCLTVDVTPLKQLKDCLKVQGQQVIHNKYPLLISSSQTKKGNMN